MEEKTTIGKLTLGIMGGVSVPFRNPSQLKPSNHLKGGKNPTVTQGQHKKKTKLLQQQLSSPTDLAFKSLWNFSCHPFWGPRRKSVQQPRGDTTQVEIANTQMGTMPWCPGSCSFPSKAWIPPTGHPECPCFSRGVGLTPNFMLRDVPLVVFLRFAQGGWVSPKPSHKNIHPIHSCCSGDGGREDPARMDEINCSWNGSLTRSHPNKLLRHHVTPPTGPGGRMNLHYG